MISEHTLPKTRRWAPLLIGATLAGLGIAGIAAPAHAEPTEPTFAISGVVQTPEGTTTLDYLEDVGLSWLVSQSGERDCDQLGTLESFNPATGEYRIVGVRPGRFTVSLAGTTTVNGISHEWDGTPGAIVPWGCTEAGGGAGEGVGAIRTPSVSGQIVDADATAPAMVAPAFGKVEGSIKLNAEQKAELASAGELNPIAARIGVFFKEVSMVSGWDALLWAENLPDMTFGGPVAPGAYTASLGEYKLTQERAVTVPAFGVVHVSFDLSGEGSGSGEPGVGEEPPAIQAPEQGELVEGARGGVTAPQEVTRGASIAVSVGVGLAGQTVHGWLFSTPTSLGSAVVNPKGVATFTVPSSVPAGNHRVAIKNAAGTLIGWSNVRVLAAGELAETGGTVPLGLAVGGVLVLAAGAGVLVANRRRFQSA